MSNPDQKVLKVLGVVFTAPWTESGSHSLQGFFSDASHIQSYEVQESYYPDFRGGIGGRVWVGAVIGIDPS